MNAPLKNWISLSCVPLALLVWIGCDEQVDQEPAPRVVVTADIESATAGNNQFALDLYQRLGEAEDGNLFFSPFSISTALAMTYAGARGDTEAEMAQALRFGLPQDKLHEAIGSIGNDLNQADADRGFQLSVANRLWPRFDIELLDDFVATVKEKYQSDLVPLDYVSAAEPSRERINQWVAKQTNDKIRELLPTGVIDDTTVLVLTNAIYFKGDWAKQFKLINTNKGEFHKSKTEKVDVDLMYQKSKFRFAELDGFQVIELPYQGDQLSMWVVLPDEIDGLDEVEKGLSVESLESWNSKLAETEVKLWLPKFKMTSQFRLRDTLSAMGMPTAFTAAADFSGINGQNDLYISAVIHKAFVEVNEEGTEAAAATGVLMKVEAALNEPRFRADHPFLFLIRDKHTGGILFMGRVMDPSA